MNAEQYRRVESQLSVVAEFFAETKNLGEPAQALREDLRVLIDKVAAGHVAWDEGDGLGRGDAGPLTARRR